MSVLPWPPPPPPGGFIYPGHMSADDVERLRLRMVAAYTGPAESPFLVPRSRAFRLRRCESFAELMAAPGWFLAWLFTFGRMGKPLFERVESGSTWGPRGIMVSEPPPGPRLPPTAQFVSGCHIGARLPLDPPIPPEDQITRPVPPPNVRYRP